LNFKLKVETNFIRPYKLQSCNARTTAGKSRCPPLTSALGHKRAGQADAWGGRLPVVFDGDSSDEKYNKKIQTLAVDGHPNDEETHNNQPEDSVGDGGRYYDEMVPRRNV
jgi:hypothetical protein